MAFQPQPQPLFQPQPFPAYGYCDSYFVGNHDDDDGTFARAAAERERQRQMAKMTQRALADELSQVTADEYQEDVLSHMERMEKETMPDLTCIEIQSEIQWFMRPYLLDFLLEAHHAFQLLPETLHLAVNLLDRYCSKRVVYKRHYQLVGCAALLIAAKYGDRKERVPTIRELKSMCCALYDDDMFTQMEWHVLQTLNWIIGHPTVTSFVDLALSDGPLDQELQHMTLYLTELALYHKEFIPVRPSMMARSALGLARCILNRPQPRYNSWTAQYESQVVLNLSAHLVGTSPALARKYASAALSSASTTIETFMARQAALAQQQRPVHTPSPEVQVGAYSGQLLTPQTPHGHKFGYNQVPLGVLTPPITPDKDPGAQQSFDANPEMAAIRVPPPAHTPPPSVSQQQQLHYAPHQHILPLPQLQFVQ